jgi:large exoprotein involved in heme utilization and adhesion
MIGSRVSSSTLGPGHAGDISVRSNILTLLPSSNDFTEFNASTSGTGHGGNISVCGLAGPGSRASSITLSGLSSLRSETQGSTGTAGNITIEAVRLTLTEGSQITTASSLNSSGDAGNVTLNATHSVLVSGSFVSSDVSQGGTGIGGTISITTPKLTVDQGSVGFGGVISTSTSSSKSAGTITINSNRVFLNEGSRLSSNSILEELMSPPTGAAGSVVLQGVDGPGSHAHSIVIGGKDDSGASSGVFTNTQGSGAGGNITLNANHVQLHSGGTITANSAGEARAGNINITATSGLTMTQNSSITTRVPQSGIGSNAGGGNIKITTSPSATIHLQNSTISASVGDGRGGGGNISIDPQLVILQDSNILAQADEGRGGKITIIAGLVLPDANSTVNADSGSGVNGTVTIQSPTSNLSGTVGQLVSKTSPPQVLVHSRCAALVGGRESTFIFAGRSTVPSEPGGWLLSPLALASAETSASTLTDTDPRVISSNQTKPLSRLSVRQIAPPWFLAKPLASGWSTGCRS